MAEISFLNSLWNRAISGDKITIADVRAIEAYSQVIANEARQEPVGDAIEIDVAPETMKFVMDKIKLKNKTIAKRTLTPVWVIELWASGKGDKYDYQVYIWKLKILASLTKSYGWAIFLLEARSLPKALKGGK